MRAALLQLGRQLQKLGILELWCRKLYSDGQPVGKVAEWYANTWLVYQVEDSRKRTDAPAVLPQYFTIWKEPPQFDWPVWNGGRQNDIEILMHKMKICYQTIARFLHFSIISQTQL